MKMLFYIPIISEVGNALLSLLLILDSWVYRLISSSYKVFMALSGARLLSSDAFSTIANKMYIVVGVVMLFVLSYAIIKAIIDPDQMTKGELGGPKLIKGVLVAVIGLGITPVLFNMLYQAQGIILEKNILGNIFFRSESNSVKVEDTSFTDDDGNTINIKLDNNEIVPDDVLKESGGALVGTYIWQAFFYPASGNMEDAKNIEVSTTDYFVDSVQGGATCAIVAGGIAAALGATLLLGVAVAAIGGAACYLMSDANGEEYFEKMGDEITLHEAYVYSAQSGDFGIYSVFLDEVSSDEGSISYVFIISTIVGGFVLYAFISFSIDMGVRCAKLAYYQIIAPILLILQVLPKFKESFKKYINAVFSTFLEVFIRISVVYVVVYIVCHLTDLFSTSGVWAGLGSAEGLFAQVLLNVGLIIFAKQAPKMIQETFGVQSGSMSFGIGKKLADGGAFAVGGVIGGGVMGAVNGFGAKKDMKFGQRLTGALGGTARGMWSGVRDNKKKMADSFGSMTEQWKNAGAYQREKLEEKENLIADHKKNKDGTDRSDTYAYVAGKFDNAKRKTKRYVFGASNVDSEKAAMNVMGEMNNLQGNLRAEAEKKDSLTKTLKRKYDDLCAKKIEPYKDGWTEESYNEELRRRLSVVNDAYVDDELSKQLFDLESNGKITDADSLNKLHSYQAALAHYENKQNDLAVLRNRLTDPTLTAADRADINNQIATAQAELATHKADLDAARKDLSVVTVDGTIVSAESVTSEAKAKIKDTFDAVAKYDENSKEYLEIQMEHQKAVDAAKAAYETASDIWVNQAIMKGDNPFINQTVSNAMESIFKDLKKGGNQIVEYEVYDASLGENVTKKGRLSDVVKEKFGSSVEEEGKINISVLADQGFEYEFGVDKDSGKKLTVKMENISGKWKYVKYLDGASTGEISDAQLLSIINSVDDRKSFKQTNAIGDSKDIGKTGEAYIRTHQYADKIKEMEEENKDKK